jgi:hypothetical protein
VPTPENKDTDKVFGEKFVLADNKFGLFKLLSFSRFTIKSKIPVSIASYYTCHFLLFWFNLMNISHVFFLKSSVFSFSFAA